MDVQAALSELTELSSQVEAAVILGPSGGIEGSTFADEAKAAKLASAAAELLDAAAAVGSSSAPVTRVEVALPAGSVFVVREGGRAIVATTAPEPTSGLVVYDLRTCLRRIGEKAGA